MNRIALLLLAVGASAGSLSASASTVKLNDGSTESCEKRDARNVCVSEVTYRYADGSRIVGRYTPGTSHFTGKATTFMPNGDVMTCESVDPDGDCAGKVSYTRKDGSVFIGRMKVTATGNPWTGPITQKWSNGVVDECDNSGTDGTCLGAALETQPSGIQMLGTKVLKKDGTSVWSGKLTRAYPHGLAVVCENAAENGDCALGLLQIHRPDGAEIVGRGTVAGSRFLLASAFYQVNLDGSVFVCPVVTQGQCTGMALMEKTDGTLREISMDPSAAAHAQ